MAHSPACGRRSSLSGGVSCRTPLGDLTFPLSKADRPSVRCTATGESDPDRTPSSLGLTEFRLVLLSQNAAFEVFENHIMKEIPVGT